MRKVLGLAAVGLIAAAVMLGAPGRSNAQVCVTPGPVIAPAPVVAVPAYPTYTYYPTYGQVVRPGVRVWVGPRHHYRHYHARRGCR